MMFFSVSAVIQNKIDPGGKKNKNTLVDRIQKEIKKC